ncbi:DUF4062 domain-containing protein [Pelodictyon phaeoclathratiforme]|nr:DUF4062 domain-containing protein [Chlorobium sp.]
MIEYRNSVMEVLRGNEMIYRGMEFFGASENTPIDVCFQNIAESDRMIVLLGTRYGSRPDCNSHSFTELEIREAERLGKPILIYILDTDRQPVLIKHVDSGKNKSDLDALINYLSNKYSVQKYVTPEELGVILARDLLRIEKDTNTHRGKNSLIGEYRETAYDKLAYWYDHWYKDHWELDDPFKTIVSIIKAYDEGSRGNILRKKILDCACGTGNTYVSFTKNGYNIYGTDGSRYMLQKAKNNCDSIGVSTDHIELEPLNWTDNKSYHAKFSSGFFDVIINTANSFCHIPPVSGYMDVALNNFYDLLAPGGLLIIDTKKYIKTRSLNDIETYQELRYIAGKQEWILRSEREEPRNIEGLGNVKFHTRLMYDNDPAFTHPVCRALIVVTIYGESINPCVHVIPYYPLPSVMLKMEMEKAGFMPVTIFPAMENLVLDWKYDIVVGRKPG